MRNDSVNRRTLAVVTIAAIMLIATTTSMATTGNVFAYNRNQATTSANACGNGEVPTNIGCQNTDSQIQGDENTVALASEQTFPSITTSPEPPTTETGTLTVIKEVVCPAGIACPDPEDFGLTVTGNNPDPDEQFPGSSGTEVKLGPGSYSVAETSEPTLPAPLENTASFSEGCKGIIEAGDTLTCTVRNTLSTEDLVREPIEIG